ncbi:unnamed protein product, partial [Vitis vinifera]
MDVVKIPQALIKKDQFSVAEKIALSKRALIALLALVIAGFNMQSSAAQLVIMRQLTKQFWKLRLQVHLKLTWRKLCWVVKNLSEGPVSLLISASDSKLKLFDVPMRRSLE